MRTVICSLLAFFPTMNNAKTHPGSGGAYLLGGFVGSLVPIVLFWLIVRAIYHWITKKKAIEHSNMPE
jgi:hypothetical protein